MSSSIIPQSGDDFQTFFFNGIEVRAKLDDNGDPVILADAVCDALALSNVSQALASVPDDEKGICKVYTLGGWQNAFYVTEPGLYRLIFRSNKPQAESFRKKVFSEILPAIRKTGTYNVTPPKTQDTLRAIATYMDKTDAKVAELEYRLESGLDAINNRLDNAEYFRVETYCKLQGINVKPGVWSKWGKAAGELSRERGIQIRQEEVSGKNWPTEKMYNRQILAIVCKVANVWQANQLTYLDSE